MHFRKDYLTKTSFLKEDKIETKTDKKFWEYHLNEIKKNPHCQQSGDFIIPSRMSICHIFPKRKTGGYPSVQSNLINAIYLHVDLHSRFDRLLNELDFEKLEVEFANVWPEVIQKVKLLLPDVTENGKLKEKFESYINSKNI